MADANDTGYIDVPPLSFTQVNEAGQKVGSEIVLTQRALPKRDGMITFEGDMAAEFVHYPGNPIKTVQILGAVEGSMTISGVWKDRFIGDPNAFASSRTNAQVFANFKPAATLDGSTIPTVVDLVQAFDTMRRQGLLVKMVWGPYVRIGIIKHFRAAHITIHDVDWTLDLEWISQGEPLGPITPARGADLSQSRNALRNIATNLSDAIVAPFADLTAKADEIRAGVQSVNAGVEQVSAAISQSAAAIASPVQAATSSVSILATIAGSAESLAASVARQCVWDSFYGLPPQAVTLGQYVKAQAYNRFIRSNARAARDVSNNSALDVAQQVISPTLLAVVEARDGQDMRDVSNRFYNTPEHWRDLARFNGVTTSKLEPGQIVYVPPLASIANPIRGTA